MKRITRPVNHTPYVAGEEVDLKRQAERDRMHQLVISYQQQQIPGQWGKIKALLQVP